MSVEAFSISTDKKQPISYIYLLEYHNYIHKTDLVFIWFHHHWVLLHFGTKQTPFVSSNLRTPGPTRRKHGFENLGVQRSAPNEHSFPIRTGHCAVCFTGGHDFYTICQYFVCSFVVCKCHVSRNQVCIKGSLHQVRVNLMGSLGRHGSPSRTWGFL